MNYDTSGNIVIYSYNTQYKDKYHYLVNINTLFQTPIKSMDCCTHAQTAEYRLLNKESFIFNSYPKLLIYILMFQSIQIIYKLTVIHITGLMIFFGNAWRLKMIFLFGLWQLLLVSELEAIHDQQAGVNKSEAGYYQPSGKC